MATAQLHADHAVTTPEHTAAQTESTADQFFTFSAMSGAVCGAVVGVALAGPATAGFDSALFAGFTTAVFGTFGTMLGSVAIGAVGLYLLLPAWSALFASNKHRE